MELICFAFIKVKVKAGKIKSEGRRNKK